MSSFTPAEFNLYYNYIHGDRSVDKDTVQKVEVMLLRWLQYPEEGRIEYKEAIKLLVKTLLDRYTHKGTIYRGLQADKDAIVEPLMSVGELVSYTDMREVGESFGGLSELYGSTTYKEGITGYMLEVEDVVSFAFDQFLVEVMEGSENDKFALEVESCLWENEKLFVLTNQNVTVYKVIDGQWTLLLQILS